MMTTITTTAVTGKGIATETMISKIENKNVKIMAKVNENKTTIAGLREDEYKLRQVKAIRDAINNDSNPKLKRRLCQAYDALQLPEVGDTVWTIRIQTQGNTEKLGLKENFTLNCYHNVGKFNKLMAEKGNDDVPPKAYVVPKNFAKTNAQVWNTFVFKTETEARQKLAQLGISEKF